jgi:hypothetical protein
MEVIMKYLVNRLVFLVFLIVVGSSIFYSPAQSVGTGVLETPILYPGEYLYSSDLFPAQGHYITPMGSGVTFANGIILRNMVHRSFTASFAPPELGTTQSFGFNAVTDFEISVDEGITWIPESGTTTCTVQIYHARDSSDVSFYDVEMLQMDIGDLISGIIIRESPSKQSLGTHKIRTVSGSYFINSFFDVFFEISTDFGLTFNPALSSWRLFEVSFLSPKPWVLTPSDMFPPNGKYRNDPGDQVSYSPGIVIQNFTLRGLDHVAHFPSLYSNNTFVFSGMADFQLSTDGGLTFTYLHAPVSLSVKTDHTADSGSINLFETEMLQMDITGGDLSVMRFRESPTKASKGRTLLQPDGDEYRISSFFDIFTEVSVDGGATWYTSSNTLSISLFYPAEYGSMIGAFPPDVKFKTAEGDVIAWASGIQMRNIVHKNFSGSVGLPALGMSVVGSYSEVIDYEISFDGGLTWSPGSTLSSNSARMTHVSDDIPASFYNVEMLSMNIGGGSLPSGVLLRESPTRASWGKYNVKAYMINNMISSFFDIYLELSTDGGASWMPASKLHTIDMFPGCPPISVLPSTIPDGNLGSFYNQTLTSSGGTPPYLYSVSSGSLPSGLELSTGGKISGTPTFYGNYQFTVMATDSNGCPGYQAYSTTIYPGNLFTTSYSFPQYGKYISPSNFVVTYPQGVVLRNLTFDYFWPYAPLPLLGIGQVYPFTATIDYEISYDAGQTWQYVRVPNSATIGVTHSSDAGDTEYYDMETLQFNLSGGDMMAGVMMRESPTLASLSKMYLQTVSGGYNVSSFFDIFTELSVDGGQTWAPAQATLPMELQFYTPQSFSSDLFPSGRYKMNPDDIILWPMGITMKNAIHHSFDSQAPLPSPGMNQVYTFTGTVTLDISLDAGLTWSPYDATAIYNITLNHVADEGSLGLYTSTVNILNIGGGSLPPVVMIRESPTRLSTGEMDVIALSDGYKIDSFFDIFLEISVDGGMSWSPADHLMKIELEWEKVGRDIPIVGGWNMISVPLTVGDYQKSVLFPTAISSAFAYEGSYIEKDTLDNGTGYWVKFSGAQTIEYTGYPRFSDTVNVSNGWNLIGALSEPLAVTDISSSPPGIITSNFFEYDRSYVVSDSLLCGKAYWVKVERDGQLILTQPEGSGLTAGQIKIIPTSELPPAPPIDPGTIMPRELPEYFSLVQNYPNPFNPLTMINYTLPEPTYVKLSIFNMLGQEVKILVDGMQDAGYKTVEFHGDNLPSGMYTYRIVVGTFTGSRKMILIK